MTNGLWIVSKAVLDRKIWQFKVFKYLVQLYSLLKTSMITKRCYLSYIQLLWSHLEVKVATWRWRKSWASKNVLRYYKFRTSQNDRVIHFYFKIMVFRRKNKRFFTLFLSIQLPILTKTHIWAKLIVLKKSDIMEIMDTFGHAHYFHVYPRCARIHIMKIMCMTKSVIIQHNLWVIKNDVISE